MSNTMCFADCWHGLRGELMLLNLDHDSQRYMVVVIRIRRNIIRTALCCIT